MAEFPPPQASASVEVKDGKKALSILDLPHEIQKDICSQCSQYDLICLSLVSKKFHELAASQLYRNFHIVFPDEDDPTFDSPIDGLAGGLDTFVTSEYNYAQHLRNLSLDTLSTGDKAEAAYKPYLFAVSCGKFMNTLLLLTLRKAKSLNTFRWNIRVELSRPVFKALHEIKTLKHLHIRLQAGPSLYEIPPPLPYQPLPSYPSPGTLGPIHWGDVVPPPPPPPMSMPPPPPPGLLPLQSGAVIAYGPPPVLPPPPPVFKPSLRGRPSKKSALFKEEPSTLGGFKGLETLAILDIDNLDIVAEIQDCLKNSALTLRKLKLSFSDDLAMQARKPSTEVDPNESDDDDELFVPSSNNYDDGSGPAKAFRAQEERKAQESVLGRIFDIEPSMGKKLIVAREEKKKAKDAPAKDAGKDFISALHTVSQRLLSGVHGTTGYTQAHQDMLDTIMKAAQKYVDSNETQASVASKDKPNATGADGEASSSESTGARDLASEDAERAKPLKVAEASEKGEKGLFDTVASKSRESRDEAKPEDIDVTAPPEEQLAEDAQEDQIKDVPANEDSAPDHESSVTPDPVSLSEALPIRAKDVTGQSAVATDGTNDSALEKTLSDSANQIDGAATSTIPTSHKPIGGSGDRDENLQHEINVVEAELLDGDNAADHILTQDDEMRRKIRDYARDTRGIGLTSLSIHLIPVKASVLGRAVDFRTLKKITLLNVGNQAPIWTLMAKENQLQPLPLRKIFTDNVSPAFLQLVSELERVTELFMLERGSKYKPESFAPKAKVTLDRIRRFALKKHIPTLKRLFMKNESDTSWDVDDKTIQLICRRGKDLEELAAIMGIRTIHTFLQHLNGLISLRALHIISFRSDDTCLSVMRETRRFIIDTVTHCPELPLEWISMGDDERAERIVRKSDVVKKTSKKSKGKEKATGSSTTTTIDTFPVLNYDPWELGSESEDDDEEDGDSDAPHKLELIESMNLYDIWGVRIFKKEIMAGRV